jgi:serine/threonine-protein kinase
MSEHQDHSRGTSWQEAAVSTVPPATTVVAVGADERHPLGEDVPGYEVVGELGRGGMGVVFKARDVRLDRVVALKMILAGSRAGAAELQRFHAEARAVARLRHPNIIQIHEIGEAGGRPYLSLELADGGRLAERLSAGPLPPGQAALLVEALARGVQAAHECGIVHRDLKPGNVLLQRKRTTDYTDHTDKKKAGSSSSVASESSVPSVASVASVVDLLPKITDFGLAKVLEDDTARTASGAILGTPSYMAPEQAQGKKEAVGPLADVWALGAILYECLTGRPPFKADTPLDTVLQLTCEEPAPPRKLDRRIPRDLETICLKCLQKEPHKRYLSAADLAADLRRWLDGEPIVARPLGPVGRLLRWARRQPALAATWAALALFYANHLLCTAVFRVVEGVDGGFHAFVTTLVVAWALAALLFQRLSQRPGWAEVATFAWAGTDVVLFTLLLGRADGPKSALVVGYLLLVGGAALRYRPRLVGFVTGLSLLGYLGLTLDAQLRRPEMRVRSHESFIFLLSLVLMGLMLHLLARRGRSAGA